MELEAAVLRGKLLCCLGNPREWLRVVEGGAAGAIRRAEEEEGAVEEVRVTGSQVGEVEVAAGEVKRRGAAVGGEDIRVDDSDAAPSFKFIWIVCFLYMNVNMLSTNSTILWKQIISCRLA